jgi:hypothetical protein
VFAVQTSHCVRDQEAETKAAALGGRCVSSFLVLRSTRYFPADNNGRHYKDGEDRYSDKEKHLRDGRAISRNAGETKDPSDQRNDCKYDGPFDHLEFLQGTGSQRKAVRAQYADKPELET